MIATRTRRWRRAAAAGTAVLLAGCYTVRSGTSPATGTPPPLVLGTFADDYGHRLTITPTRWTQHPSMHFDVVAWRPEARYLLARVVSDSAGAPDQWARIDWVEMPPSQAPYTWAFCLSAYDAPTRAAAESTRVARPEMPRTGCNGYPFSRMARTTP